MLADGCYVLINGKYIGPAKPGPWATPLTKLNIDVFKLGPVFIAIGVLWLTFIAGLWAHQPWSYWLGLAASIATLWYFPLGTLFSVIILAALLTSKQKLGI
jgi:hypothetical protein